MTKQIIALGGGGFSMEPENPLLDLYILKQARVSSPTVCFIPTASGDADGYLLKFYSAFAGMECRATHISLFRQPKDMRDIALRADVLYVGGGNTRNMLAVWKASGFDLIIREAWESGVVLAGLSAGAICWFQEGHTDSAGELGPMNCLGFLPGSCSPHYDGEVKRRPSYQSLVKSGRMMVGFGLDDGAAIHFIDDKPMDCISSRPNAKSYKVTLENGIFKETDMSPRFLGHK